MKLEHLLVGIKKRGVNTLDKLKEVKGEEIDGWKEIAVGYRIKLKQLVVNLSAVVKQDEVKVEK